VQFLPMASREENPEPLEVRLKSATGAVDGSILSIRAGDSRRQGPLSVGTCFKFPTQRKNANPFKVDVLAPIGNGRLLLTPQKDLYNLKLGEMSLQLEVCTAKPKVSTTKGKVIDNAADTSTVGAAAKKVREESAAREYIERHDLRGCLHSLLQSVIVDMPADPFQYMAEKLYDKHPPVDVGYAAPCTMPQAAPPRRPPEKISNKSLEAAERSSGLDWLHDVISLGESTFPASLDFSDTESCTDCGITEVWDRLEPGLECATADDTLEGEIKAQGGEVNAAKPTSETASWTTSALTSPGSTRPASAASSRPASATKPPSGIPTSRPASAASIKSVGLRRKIRSPSPSFPRAPPPPIRDE